MLSRFGRALLTVITSRSKLLAKTSASFSTAANLSRALWDVRNQDGHWMENLQEASQAQEEALQAFARRQAELSNYVTPESQHAQHSIKQLQLRTELLRFDYRYALDVSPHAICCCV